MLENRFCFKARFIKLPRGKETLDWACIPQSMYRILQVGNTAGKTQYFLHPEVPRKAPSGPFPPSDFGRTEKPPRKRQRNPMRKLPERVPIKRKLFDSQQKRCFYCCAITTWEQWTLEHRLPIVKGGTNEPDNLCGSCDQCNTAKKAMTEEEFYKSKYMKDLKPFIDLEKSLMT